jgi:hypothetical protein
MRNLFVLAFVGLGACGQTAGDQNTTPAPDTAAAPAPATRPDSQPAPLMDVTITTDTRTYRPGDPVELRITNSSARRFTFNPCTRTLEREDEAGVDRWSVVKEDRMCTMIAHVLDPNSTRNERTELGEELGPGTYRMVVAFASDSPAPNAVRVTAYTQPFTVTSTR